MKRKVFISFLGTNNYIQTHYELNGICSPPVRFIQQALIGFLCKDWTSNDRVMIFYTGGSEGAYEKNWLDGGHTNLNKDSGVEKIGLYSTLKSMDFPMKIEGYEIVEGFSVKDIWSIFNCVYDKLQENDEIYFDVTHAFRSIPLFSTVLFNFTHFMKQTKLVSIHYGAFEKLGSARQVAELPLECRIAPIVDLTSLVHLQNTNVAANNFIEFGNIGTIADQLDASASPATRSQRESVEAIKCLKRELAKLNSYILTCQTSKIRKGAYMRVISEQFDKVMGSDKLLSSEKLLLKKIKDNLDAFKGETSDDNIAAAVDWAFRYGMIQQAYTLGQEFVITMTSNLLECRNPFGENEKRRFRTYISGVLGISCNSKYKDDLAEYYELTDKLLSMKWLQALRKEYDVLRRNRNDLNHASGRNKNIDDLKKEFESSYNKCIEILKRGVDNY